jgi:hypothetical protein
MIAILGIQLLNESKGGIMIGRLICALLISILQITVVCAETDVHFSIFVNGEPVSGGCVLHDGDILSISPVYEDGTIVNMPSQTMTASIYLIDSDNNEKWGKRIEGDTSLFLEVMPGFFEGVDLSDATLIHDPYGDAYHSAVVKCSLSVNDQELLGERIPIRFELIPAKPLIQEVVVDSLYSEITNYLAKMDEGITCYWLSIKALSQRSKNARVDASWYWDGFPYNPVYSYQDLGVTEGIADGQIALFSNEFFHVIAWNEYGYSLSETLNMTQVLTDISLPTVPNNVCKVVGRRILTPDGTPPEYYRLFSSKGELICQEQGISILPIFDRKGVCILQVKPVHQECQTIKILVK